MNHATQERSPCVGRVTNQPDKIMRFRSVDKNCRAIAVLRFVDEVRRIRSGKRQNAFFAAAQKLRSYRLAYPATIRQDEPSAGAFFSTACRFDRRSRLPANIINPLIDVLGLVEK